MTNIVNLKKGPLLLPIVVTGTVIATTLTLAISHRIIKKAITRLRLQRLLVSKKAGNDGEEEEKAEDDATMIVSDLFIYPVKSLRAVSLQTVELDEKGFQGDRRFMVVAPVPTPAWGDFLPTDSTHRFLSQRQCPSLATVDAIVKGDVLLLSCNGKTIELSTQPPQPTTTYRVGIWSDQVQVQDMGDEVAAFFQAIINADSECKLGDEGDTTTNTTTTPTSCYPNVRLVSHTLHDRHADRQFVPSVARSWVLDQTPPLSLTDGFPILIASQASLDELNRRLVQEGKETIPMSRFRPNIVIQGPLQPFEEDQWKVIAIGGSDDDDDDQQQPPLLFSIVKACPRCKQSCTDQETGKVSSEPVGIMGSFRALGQNGSTDVFFAQNALALNQTGTIKKGARVRVLERGDPLYC